MIDPDPDDPEEEGVRGDDVRKFGALIRAHFGLNPYKLSDEKFVELAQEALWIEQFRQVHMRELNAQLVADIVAIKLSG